MLDHRKPVRDQALCQKRHIPVEGNVGQVSNPVLENNMAKKKKKSIHINLHVIWRSFDDV